MVNLFQNMFTECHLEKVFGNFLRQTILNQTKFFTHIASTRGKELEYGLWAEGEYLRYKINLKMCCLLTKQLLPQTVYYHQLSLLGKGKSPLDNKL